MFRRLLETSMLYSPDEPAGGAPAEPPASTPAEGDPAPEGSSSTSGIAAEDDLDDDASFLLGSDDFDEGFNGRGRDHGGPPPAPAPAEPPSPGPSGTPPEAKPGTEAQPAPAAAAPPSPSPAEPQPSQPSASQPEPAKPQPTLVEQFEANREAIVESLARESYSLNPEALGALGFDDTAGQVVSRLAATIHLNAVRATYHALAKQVPAMIASAVPVILEQRKSRETYASQFAKRWPQIKPTDKAHADALRRFGQSYVASNKDVPVDKAIEDIGLLVTQALGLPVTAPAAAAPASGAAPARVSSTRIAPAPHSPAVGGSSPPPQPSDADPYWGMGADFDEGFNNQ